MRSLALVLALVALAGCLAPSTPTPTTGATTPTEPTTPPAPPTTSVEQDGFVLEGAADAADLNATRSITFRFVATNVAGATEALFDPCGGGNPKVHIEDASGATLSIRPPVVRCMAAASYAPFPAGAQDFANLTWNGRTYQGEQASPAPAGHYRAVAVFDALRDGHGVDVKATLAFDVR